MPDQKNNSNCSKSESKKFCCNGYVQDANEPNRYVNLETGEERDLNERGLGQLNVIITWILIALLLGFINNSRLRKCSNIKGANPQTVTKHNCNPQ